MKYLTQFVAGTALAIGLAALGSSGASAANVTVTWDPAGSSTPLSNASDLTFNGINVNDYAAINLTPTSANTFSVTDQGYLSVTGFTPGITTPGLNGLTAGATTYSLYFQFDATANITCLTATVCAGSFTSLNYSLMGDPGKSATFGFTGTTATVGNNTGAIQLAHGVLASGGQNEAHIIGGIPGAALTATFIEDELGFFIAPPDGVVLDLFGSFTNSEPNVTVVDCSKPGSNCPAGVAEAFLLGANGSPGGGTVNFEAIPEPASFTLFGASLLIAGFALRRRRKI